MHYASNSAAIPLEMITAYSYLLIALGYGLRQMLEEKPQLLWPWSLVAIFLLCGTTRVTGFVGAPVPEGIVLAMHLALAPLSLAYGIGQLIYAFWPTLFDADTGPDTAFDRAPEPDLPDAPLEKRDGGELSDRLERLQALVRSEAVA